LSEIIPKLPVVGGFNPFEKYYSSPIGSFPQVGMKRIGSFPQVKNGVVLRI